MKLGELFKGQRRLERVAFKQEARDIMKRYNYAVSLPWFMFEVSLILVAFLMKPIALFELWLAVFLRLWPMNPIVSLELTTDNVVRHVLFILFFFWFMALIKYYLALARTPKEVYTAGFKAMTRFSLSDGGWLRFKYSSYIGVLGLLLLHLNTVLMKGKEIVLTTLGMNDWSSAHLLVDIMIVGVFGYLFLNVALLFFIIYDTTSSANHAKPLSFKACVQKSIRLMKGRKLELLALLLSFVGWYSLIYSPFLLNAVSLFGVEDPGEIIIIFFLFIIPGITIAIILLFLYITLFVIPYQLLTLALWMDRLTADDPDIIRWE